MLTGRGRTPVWRQPSAFVGVLAWVVILFSAQLSAAFRNVEPGAKAPDFSLQSATGKTVSLGEFRGKVLAVAFVRLNQDKSARALKDLAQLTRTSSDLSAIAVVVNPDEGDPQAWATELQVDIPFLLDTSGGAYSGYGVMVVPATGVIDPDGNLVEVVSGHSSGYVASVETHVATALGREPVEESATTAGASVDGKTEERKAAERHLEKARLLMKRKMKDKAALAAKQAAAADPSYAEGQVFAGTALLDLSDDNADEALGYFEKALEVEPRNTDARIGVARVQSLRGEYEAAAALLKQLASLNPKPERLYYQLGLVYERAGQYQDAVAAYRKALERLLE